MTTFTPLASLLGGMLIGLAAVLLMALHGRIAGITGILSGILPPHFAPDKDWRAAFVIGVLAAPLVFWFALGTPDFASRTPLVLVLLSGVLVGLGVSYGGGCTSGHGVCGLSRLSRRSFVAVATFMLTAAATVFVTRQLIGG